MILTNCVGLLLLIVDTARQPRSANKVVVEPFGHRQERPRYSPLADEGAPFKQVNKS